MKRIWLPIIWLTLNIGLFAEESPNDQGRFPIEQRLRDDDPGVIHRALHHLEHSELKSLLAVKERLIQLCSHSSSDVRLVAIERLGDIGRPAADALPALKTNLRDSNPGIRIAAASAIWKVAGDAKPAVPVLVTELRGSDEAEESDDERWYRDTAASELQSIGPDAGFALDDIAKLLDDRRAFVRVRATETLGSLGPKFREQAEPRLTAALKDPNARVRIVAARGLKDIDASLDQAIPVLVAVATQEVPISDHSKHGVWGESYVESSAVIALGQCEGDAAPAVATLAQLLESHVLALRLESAIALGRIGPAAADAIPVLSKSLRDSKRYSFPFAHNSWCVGDNAATALELIGAPAAPTLLEALKDWDPRVRALAAHALGGIPDAASQTVAPLLKSLEDPEAAVRIAAVKSLGRLKAPALSAAPALVKLLQDNQHARFIRAGLRFSISESVCGEADQALLAMNAPAQQVVRTLIETLQKAQQITSEQLATLHRYARDAAAAKEPLETLLERSDSRLAVAYALSLIDPNHVKIEGVLKDAISDHNDADSFAARGLLQLASAGKSFDAKTRSQFLEIADAHEDPYLCAVLLRLSPNDEKAATRLLNAIFYENLLRGRDLSEIDQTLCDLAKNKNVGASLVRQLTYVIADEDKTEDADPDYIRRLEEEMRFRAARILIEAGLNVQEAIECLRQLADWKSCTLRGEIIQVMAEHPAISTETIPLLTKQLQNNGRFDLRNRIYDNGAEVNVIGDWAALALVKIQAVAALEDELNHKDADVRIRVVRALGHFGKKTITPQLLACADDLDHRVRRETLRTLGRIGDKHPEVRPELLAVLRAAQQDRRLAVRDEAGRVLARWNLP